MTSVRRARFGLTVLALTVAAGGWFVVPIVRVELDETSIPPGPTTTSFPAGVQVFDVEELCGSGGCYRQATIGWPGHTRAQVLAVVGLNGSRPQEICSPVSLVDRRRACVGADDSLLTQPPSPDQVRIYVRWHRPLGL